MTTRRPNFLFLITDQHRADHVGFGGNAVIQTPHLDRLAARGTVFERAFVANPICMPNRATMMTGRMPSSHRTRFNGVSLDWRANTFVRRLRQAGYRTTHIGKSHLQTMCISRERILELVDFTLAEEALLPAAEDGWDELEDYRRYRDGDVPSIDDFYGFERASFAVLHGDQVSGHYNVWLEQRGVDWRKIQGPHNALDRYHGWIQIYQTAVPTELYPSTYIGDATIAEIEAAKADGRPFFIHASWPDPHHPFTPPGEYWRMYDPASMPLPSSFTDPHHDSMPHYKAMIAQRGVQTFSSVDGWAPTAAQLRHAMAAEYGNISLIDDNVGRILQALECNGLADDTIVIFTSDHGDMFGDHGVMLKFAMHYQGCLKVPLVIARPGQPSKRTRALAGSIDLAQTILELAGIDGFHGMQGCSLVPILDDSTATVRDAVYIEEDEKVDLTFAGVPTRMRTLVTNEGRLTLYKGHTHGELFAADDTDEMRNIFSKAEGCTLRERMTEQLVHAMMTHSDETPRPRYNA